MFTLYDPGFRYDQVSVAYSCVYKRKRRHSIIYFTITIETYSCRYQQQRSCTTPNTEDITLAKGHSSIARIVKQNQKHAGKKHKNHTRLQSLSLKSKTDLWHLLVIEEGKHSGGGYAYKYSHWAVCAFEVEYIALTKARGAELGWRERRRVADLFRRGWSSLGGALRRRRGGRSTLII